MPLLATGLEPEALGATTAPAPSLAGLSASQFVKDFILIVAVNSCVATAMALLGFLSLGAFPAVAMLFNGFFLGVGVSNAISVGLSAESILFSVAVHGPIEILGLSVAAGTGFLGFDYGVGWLKGSPVRPLIRVGLPAKLCFSLLIVAGLVEAVVVGLIRS